MDFINNVAKSPCYLPTKRLRDFEENKLYKLSKIKQVQTKFGKKIVIELDKSFDIFLPSKLNNLLLEDNNAHTKINEEIEKNTLQMKYLGKCLLEFI